MKTYITLLITLLISFSTFAQQGINYKALIKDDTGNVLSSVPLSVRFTIYKDDPEVPANSVYQESHTLNTDVNGLIILNIGSEAVGDSFTSINWEDSAHWLEVEINTGTGFVPMGEPTAFNSVPYAMHAETASNAATKINELADGKSDDDGTENGSSLFIGVDAGLNDDGTNNQNVGLGYQALISNTTGFFNTANGASALYSNTSGERNTASGKSALKSNTSGSRNTANGTLALFNNISGSSNTASGNSALYSNILGAANTANGSGALYSNTSGNYNTANGVSALNSNETGVNNAAYGAFALYSNITGENNTAIGYYAGNSNTSGNNNVFIGRYTGNSINAELNDKLYIDNTSTENPLIYGEFNTNLVRINGVLDVTGGIRTPATGDANMAPIAYGGVNGAATPVIQGGTENFTVTRNITTNEYTISVNGESLSSSNSVISVSINTPNFRSHTVTFSGGNAIVHIFTSSFVKVASPFQFVIYQE